MVRGWAERWPDIVRLESVAKTPEGRDVWLLTIGPEPDRTRPAVWVDGNMHATEVCGSSVALAIAEDVIRLHLGETTHGLAPAMVETLREVLFYVMPRMSPDGAEHVLATGGYVRSVPRDERAGKATPRWVPADLDGDGLMLAMRVVDPTGELVESKTERGLMVPRTFEDEGPYYKVYPEGRIEPWDGSTVPTPSYLGGNDPDFNRNFPWSWAPEPDQIGAGRHPISEPETRAVVEVTTKRPHLFAWLNLHTFGGVLIRPLGHAPDSKMEESDLAIYKLLAGWAESWTGYPTVSGHDEFLYEPDKPLRGDLTDYAYHQRGCIAWVVELWDFFRQIGAPGAKRFVDQYANLGRADWERFAKWDREHNAGRVVRPWNRVTHPQLGEVEVGGYDSRIGVSNPPLEMLAEVCRTQSAVLLRVAALAPRVVVSTRTEKVAEGVVRVEATIENRGWLPTHVLTSAKKLPWNEPLRAEVTTEGCTLLDPASAHAEIGHLDGWGRGPGETSIFWAWTRGTTGRRVLRWTVQGTGRVKLRVGACRVGWQELEVEV